MKAYFSPKGGCTAAIVLLISQAKLSIRVQAYSFTSAPIYTALIAAAARGVVVRVILDKSFLIESPHALAALLAARVPVVIDMKHAIAHNKVMILDDKTVITGSFNFTAQAELENAENVLVLPSVSIAKLYAAEWELHFAHSVQPPPGPPPPPPAPVPINPP